jgi:hypothetical protein
MSRVGESELSRWRTAPAREVLLHLATHAKRDTTFVSIKGKETERWHANVEGREFEFIVYGPKFFDVREQAGGGGAIDLAMHLYRLDFRSAVDLLRRLKL